MTYVTGTLLSSYDKQKGANSTRFFVSLNCSFPSSLTTVTQFQPQPTPLQQMDFNREDEALAAAEQALDDSSDDTSSDSDGESDDDEEVVPLPLAQIESFDHYIERHGLRDNAEIDDAHIGEFNGMNREEAVERFREHEAHLQAELRKDVEAEEKEGETSTTTPRLQQDYERDDAVIVVLLRNNSRRVTMAKPLMSLCDTVKCAVLRKDRYRVAEMSDVDEQADEDSAEDDVIEDQMTSSSIPIQRDDREHKMSDDECEYKCEESDHEEEEGMYDKSETDNSITNKGFLHIMDFELTDFHPDAVMEFVDAVLSLFDLYNTTNTTLDTTDNLNHPIDEDEEGLLNHVTNLVHTNKLSKDNIVECLRIAHFVQCTSLINGLSMIIESSIDASNCLSIFSLADELDISSLYEASVNHVMKRLDSLLGDSDNNDSEDEMVAIWKSLPAELRNRLETIRNIMRSSIIGKGSKVSGVFFTSGSEFLGIFEESIRDQRERLSEAKERREEVIRERGEEWEIMRQRRGRWFDNSAEGKHEFVHGADVKYALEKIEQQQKRLKTLETFYEEQKVLFRNAGGTFTL